MNRTLIILASIIFAVSLVGISGCSEESENKLEKAGTAVDEAAKETVQEVKEDVKEAVENAQPTDPDTGLAK